MAELELDRITMSYGDVRVLHGLSLHVADGAFHAMVGPSGSGKTSALKLLAGFAGPDSGAVRIGGSDVTTVPPERRDLGIVFQNYALFPHMDVAANVAFGLRMRGLDRKKTQTRVGEMLELVGLAGFGSRYPDELSGGQQQRVALARALVIRPKALLLDEPLSALDRKIRQEMQIELRRIQQEAGVTAVIVTHDQEEALALGDRLMVLNDGRVQQEGTPFEVYNRPASEFVATFLGNANLLQAEVMATESPRMRVAGIEAPAPALPPGVRAGETLRLCIRPERWTVRRPGTDASAEATELTLSGRIAHLYQTGETAVGAMDSPAGRIGFTLLSPRLAEFSSGSEVTLSARPEDMHFLQSAIEPG